MSMDVHIDVSLKRQFFEFSIFQSSDTKAECISLRQIDRWLKQAGILDMNKITTTYTGMLFSEFGSTSMDYQSFLNFLEKLIEEKGENPDDIFKKLVKCGKPNIEEFCGDVPRNLKTKIARLSSKHVKKGYISNFNKYFE